MISNLCEAVQESRNGWRAQDLKKVLTLKKARSWRKALCHNDSTNELEHDALSHGTSLRQGILAVRRIMQLFEAPKSKKRLWKKILHPKRHYTDVWLKKVKKIYPVLKLQWDRPEANVFVSMLCRSLSVAIFCLMSRISRKLTYGYEVLSLFIFDIGQYYVYVFYKKYFCNVCGFSWVIQSWTGWKKLMSWERQHVA